ncbi:MAG: immunoglobulin-like domain-containing protein [Acutalibacteraceae bacterium]
MSAFFNTILAIFMSILSVILPAKSNNVNVTVRPVTTETARITFECENNTWRTISRPCVTSIEKKDENGEWQNVNIAFGYTEEYYSIHHGRSAVDSIELGDPFEEFTGLEKGEYRITVKYILIGDGTWGYASGDFTAHDA